MEWLASKMLAAVAGKEAPKPKRGKPIGYAVTPWRQFLEDKELPIGRYKGPLGSPIDKPKET